MNRPAATHALALLGLALILASPSALAADRDNDGLRDGFESKHGVTSPERRDSDRDGVVDGAEDSDGDKLGNLAEQRFGLDPTRQDTDGDGTKDGLEDHDGDGKSNKLEQYQLRVPKGLTPSLAKAPTDGYASAVGCNAKPGSPVAKRCAFGPTGTGTRVVLMGDSHAMMLADSIRKIAETDRFRLVTYFKGGCIPVLGAMNKGQKKADGGSSCRKWRLNAIKAINAKPPDLLIVTASESYTLVDSSGRIVPKADAPAKWRLGLQSLIDKISPRTEVLVLGDVPNNREHPVRCLKKNPGNMSKCTTRWEPLSERDVERAVRKAVDNKGEHFATIRGKICPTDPCPLVQGKTMMWRDRSHLTGTFARKLTPSVRHILRGILP